MKCPKCGYNSFEFLDSCKKCGSELETLKRTYRISPLVLSPGESIPTEIRQETFSSAADMPVHDTEGSGTAKVTEEFSWDVPGSSTVDETTETASGFDLNFLDPDKPSESAEQEYGFSFAEEAASPVPDIALPEDEGSAFDLPAAETVVEEPGDLPRELVSEGHGSGLEDYERMLEPESLQDTGSSAASSTAGDFQGSETFGMPDFSFEADPASAEVTGFGEENKAAVSAETKPKPNLEDFEKEFEKIFAVEDSPDK
jgi:hypothetical protein